MFRVILGAIVLLGSAAVPSDAADDDPIPAIPGTSPGKKSDTPPKSDAATQPDVPPKPDKPKKTDVPEPAEPAVTRPPAISIDTPSGGSSAKPSTTARPGKSGGDAGPALSEAEIETIIDRLRAMPAASQQAWLLELESSYNRACKFVYSAEEAARRQKEFAAVLRQKTLGWDAIRKLIAEVDARERAAIGRLTQQYRITVYDAFWQNEREYRVRQKALADALAAFSEAGKPAAQRAVLVDWLEAAVQASTKEKTRPLPALPKFQGKPIAATSKSSPDKTTVGLSPAAPNKPPDGMPASDNSDEPKGPPSGDVPLVPAMPKVSPAPTAGNSDDGPRPSADEPEKPDPKPPSPPESPVKPEPGEQRSPKADDPDAKTGELTPAAPGNRAISQRDEDWLAALAATARRPASNRGEPPLPDIEPSGWTPTRPAVEAAVPAEPLPFTALPLTYSPAGISRSSPFDARLASADCRVPVELATSYALAWPLPNTEAVQELAICSTLEEPVLLPPLGAPLTKAAVTLSTTAAMQAVGDEPGSAPVFVHGAFMPVRPVTAVSPGTDEPPPIFARAPLASPSALAADPRAALPTPAAAATGIAGLPASAQRSDVRVENGPREVRINITELRSRIDGNNLALRTLEAELDRIQEWDISRLRTLTERLAILVDQQNDLSLFRGLADEAQRPYLAPPVPVRPLITLLATRLHELRTRLAASTDAATADDRRLESAQLDELAQQLGKL